MPRTGKSVKSDGPEMKYARIRHWLLLLVIPVAWTLACSPRLTAPDTPNPVTSPAISSVQPSAEPSPTGTPAPSAIAVLPTPTKTLAPVVATGVQIQPERSEPRRSPWQTREHALVALDAGRVVTLFEGGGVEVLSGSDRYLLRSSFSYPAVPVGYHRFDRSPELPDSPYGLRVTGENLAEFFATFEQYTITRTVELTQGQVKIRDEMRSKVGTPLGVLVEHQMEPPGDYEVVEPGLASAIVWDMPENPTLFLRGNESNVGILAEDAVSRLQFAGWSAPDLARFRVNNFALDAYGTYTFELTIYLLSADADYFDLVNKIRKDWNVNATILGPMDFLDVTLHVDMMNDPDELRSYLNRKRLKIIVLRPWLDYDNFNYVTYATASRDEYRTMMRDAQMAIHRVDPSIKVLGAIEFNLVAVPDAVEAQLLLSMPEEHAAQGMHRSTGLETDLLRRGSERWNDSAITSPDGDYTFEHYSVGRALEVSKIALAVCPSIGNSQYGHLLEQARFILDDVGLDGVYVDQFNMVLSAGSQRYSYQSWDGVTVSIDPTNGQIARKYTDCALRSLEAQKGLIRFIADKGKFMLANTQPAVRELQALPVTRFIEGGVGSFNPLSIPAGQRPWFYHHLARGLLESPVALGVSPAYWFGKDDRSDYARSVNKAAVVFLRAGMLYWPFFDEIPEDGPGSGDYGAINHMFPITPRVLGSGFVIGEERIVTAVSGKFEWYGATGPTNVLVFDMRGLPVQPRYALRQSDGKWTVELDLEDWEQIAVVER